MRRIDIGLLLQVALAVAVVVGIVGIAPSPTDVTAYPDAASSTDFWVRMNQTESGGDLLLSVGIVAAFAWLILRSKLGRGDALPGCLNDVAVLAVGGIVIYLLYLI